MPTRKIADLPPEACTDPGHAPSTHAVYANGIYEHSCPSCGVTVTFTIANPTPHLAPRGRLG